MPSWINELFEVLFAIGLLINALLFIPQASRIWRHRKADEISLVTFGGLWLVQLLTVIHAMLTKDYILLIGYLFAMLTCGSVIILSMKYRKNDV